VVIENGPTQLLEMRTTNAINGKRKVEAPSHTALSEHSTLNDGGLPFLIHLMRPVWISMVALYQDRVGVIKRNPLKARSIEMCRKIGPTISGVFG